MQTLDILDNIDMFVYEEIGQKISVIIPTFNRSNVLGRSIASVCSQTYQNWELIVVDDGSTDNTPDTVASFDDERIRFIRCRMNSGAAAARNKGLSQSKGEFVAFLDSDDEWCPQWMESQVGCLGRLNQEWGMVYTGRVQVDGPNISKYRPAILEGLIFEEYLDRPIVSTPTALTRRRCFESVGFWDERFRRFTDWEMFLRIAKVYKIAANDEPLTRTYRTSWPKPELVRDAVKLFTEKFRSDYRRLPVKRRRTMMASHWIEISKYYARDGSHVRTLCSGIKAFTIDPLNATIAVNIIKRELRWLLMDVQMRTKKQIWTMIK